VQERTIDGTDHARGLSLPFPAPPLGRNREDAKMSEETFEFTSDRDQKYVVRPCDGEEHGCVVIEHWVTGHADPEDEPTHDVHIPVELVTLVAKALLAMQQPVASDESQ
jgi:hypothetical protein